jgi:hypothetical protein
MPRWLLSLGPLVTLGVACGGDPTGRVTAQGAWADGERIFFSEEAYAARATSGRIDVRASSPGQPRFLGLRLSYDPQRLTAPGRYPVDPAPGGWLEIYCLRLKGEEPGATSPAAIEYEASSGVVTINRVPGAGGKILDGTLEQVAVERAGQVILQLSSGTFLATPP